MSADGDAGGELESLRRQLAATELASKLAIAAVRADADAALAAARADAVAALAAARADADAARADAAVRIAAAEAHVAAMAPGAAAAPPPAPVVVAPAVPALDPLPSPTDGGAASLYRDVGFWGLVAAPLSFDSHAAVASFAGVIAAAREAATRPTFAATAAECLMAEKAYYALAVAHAPGHVTVLSAQKSAVNLFGAGALRSVRYTFKGSCMPELRAHANEGGSLPVFAGEIKSVDSRMLGQALYYALMAMTGKFFPASARAAGAAAGTVGVPGRRVFYAAPPLCCVLLAFPHVAYYASVEWVGKALIAPASQPFFLGSAEHAAAAAALPCAPRGEPVWEFDAGAPWRAPPGVPEPPPVAWAVCRDGRFRKLLRADARSAEGWAEMFAAYARLGELWSSAAADAPPAALVCGARLLFGAHEALVEMDAVAGRGATNDEVTGGAGADADGGGDGAVLRAVAEAVAWLAARCVLYTDVRGPNVLVSATGVRVVDYDDCVVAEAPVRSAANFRAELARIEAARAARRGLSVAPPTFAERFVQGDFPLFMAALDAAFEGM
jgi:hypothetical protein